ncbi:rhodanese domain protein PspE-like protein [Psychroflexus torquis ATCC 700755]|uniref:Rhodanese domain protein PspE-like protein n=1 Tax=Psychroflexus torquis (strain ATCC 700755 / CIP 106069 / ACAM 623) TaxID=313595 RepID=K4IHN7_PSYTT|nr:rhodanese-like domain-containing protein [Psychroflexus torquis]AFU70037.1 rhodanese domain protein PspE-like protein [Psychroflexus torquis ATCC 700755]
MENLNEKKWYEGLKASSNSEIIDVRTPDEFDDGYIEGARLLNIQDSSKFMAEVEKLEKDKDYYVYCRSGRRSEMACQIMEKAGVENAYNLQGGILDWTGNLKK